MQGQGTATGMRADRDTITRRCCTDRIEWCIKINIKPGLFGIGNGQAVPFKPANHALDQAIQQRLQRHLLRCRHRMESRPTGTAYRVHTVQHEHVQVNIEIAFVRVVLLSVPQ